MHRFLLAFLALATLAAADPLCPVKAKDRVLIHGDSVTAHGVGPHGFVTQVHKALVEHMADLDLAVKGDGVPNRTAPGLISAIGKVQAWKPTLVVLYIGLNDAKAKDPAKFCTDVETLLGLYADMGARVLLCTPTVRWSPGEAELDEQLELYAAQVRELGVAKGIPVLDLRKLFQEKCGGEKQLKDGPVCDGVHLSGLGNRWVAEALLAAFGCSATETTLAAVHLKTRGVKLPGCRWPGQGRISGGAQRIIATAGEKVAVTAEPAAERFTFVRWVVTRGREPVLESTDNPLELTVEDGLLVTAEFGEPEPKQ